MPSQLRTPPERLLQTLCFELLGLVLVTPLYSAFAARQLHESAQVLGVVSLGVAGWSALFNTAFDHFERRITGRVASCRPHSWRWLHATLHEASAALVTCPVLVKWSGLD